MPLSDDPERRAKQLANLRPGAGAGVVGNRWAHRHGGWATVARERMEATIAEVFDALASDAPLRDAEGGLPRHDTVAVHELAETMCRLEDVRAHLRSAGWLDQRTGEPRHSVLAIEDRLAGRVGRMLDQLGMTPTSRAKLGLDLTRTVDLATAMSDPDPAIRGALLRSAGFDVDLPESEAPDA